MMKAKIYAAALLALTLTGCNNDEMDNLLANGPVSLNVTAGINQTMTRATADGDGKAAFDAGDAINVVAGGKSTYVYKLGEDGKWSSAAPYYFQSTASVPFRAWYAVPSVSVENDKIAIDTKTQTITDGWNNHDILATPEVSVNVGGTDKAKVSFTGKNAFSHIMTQVSFTFKAGDDISDLAALSGYKLTGLVTDAAFDTQSCTLAAGSTTGDITMPVSGASGTTYTCTPIILVPQATATGTFALEVTYNGQFYKAELTAPMGGLQAGYSYTYIITVKNTKLEVNNAEIVGWKIDRAFNGNQDVTLQ